MYPKPQLRVKFEEEQGCLIWEPLACIRLDQRWERARKILLAGDVEPQTDGAYIVRSQSRSELRFNVRLNGVLGWQKGCDCEDYLKKAPWGWCKHRLSAWIYSHLTGAQVNLINKNKEVQANGDNRDLVRNQVHQQAGA